jgi:argininosuccinate lyase
MTTNLPSGYHRDLQLLKEHLFPAFATLKDCINMAAIMLGNIGITKDILSDEKYKYLFSVEEVNKLVNSGMPFRDAYKKVGLDIEANKFSYSTELNHTHEGSIGNLLNDKVAANMKQLIQSFQFEKYHDALNKLLTENSIYTHKI